METNKPNRICLRYSSLQITNGSISRSSSTSILQSTSITKWQGYKVRRSPKRIANVSKGHHKQISRCKSIWVVTAQSEVTVKYRFYFTIIQTTTVRFRILYNFPPSLYSSCLHLFKIPDIIRLFTMNDYFKNEQQKLMLPLIPHCNQAQQKNPGIATTNIFNPTHTAQKRPHRNTNHCVRSNGHPIFGLLVQ